MMWMYEREWVVRGEVLCGCITDSKLTMIFQTSYKVCHEVKLRDNTRERIKFLLKRCLPFGELLVFFVDLGLDFFQAFGLFSFLPLVRHQDMEFIIKIIYALGNPCWSWKSRDQSKNEYLLLSSTRWLALLGIQFNLSSSLQKACKS